MAPSPLTVGTAGHIDHGKTALVRALTGRDTDRLAEEQRRGMSIELGFADLDLGVRRLSLVDVPGHERFVRTMIAGASGIDMFLLAVAADDGPMPQTREHLAVLEALDVRRGVLALTKVDLADAERRRRAHEECAGLLPGAPLVEVSSRTGEGIDELRVTLVKVAEDVERERPAEEHAVHPALDVGAAAEPVLHVDRVFTIAGHGTVVTGTLWSGRLRRGDRVLVLPAGKEARIRSIQVHDRTLDAADPRQRVALNLGGIDRDEIQRGDVVTSEAADVCVTYRLDAMLESGAEKVLAEPRVQVHLGTRDSPARVVELDGDAVQLRLERPLLAQAGNRLVVRRIAPPDTLGGGVVRDPSPPRHGASWNPAAAGQEGGAAAAGNEGAAGEGSPAPGQEGAAPEGAPASTRPEPGPFARRVLAELEGDGIRPRGAVEIAESMGAERHRVQRAFGELVTAGAAVRVRADVIYEAGTYGKLERLVIALAERDGSTSIADVRDTLGLSRKYAQALLEHLDSKRLLRREGDRHVPCGPH